MNYGRRVFDRAVRGLQGFDDRYADAVYNRIAGDDAGNLSQLRAATADLLGSPLTPKRVEFDADDGIATRIGARAYQMAGPLVGGITRYGLPGAGVTAAGMGLLELTDRMNQQTESTLSVQ